MAVTPDGKLFEEVALPAPKGNRSAYRVMDNPRFGIESLGYPIEIKPLVELFTPRVMLQYAELCGWTLAHAHARSGEPAKISGYLGKSDKFDKALVDFSVAYADQSERDHEALVQAARSGRLEVFIAH